MKSKTIINIKHSAIAILISSIAGMVLAGIYAYLLSNETMQISSLNYMIPIIQFIASVIAATYICKVESENVLIKSLFQAAIILLVTFLATQILYNGKFYINIISILTIISAYLITAIVQMKKKGKSKTVRYKRKNG